ncbi:MAG: tetratricopeptide repeat protein [bacterium]
MTISGGWRIWLLAVTVCTVMVLPALAQEDAFSRADAAYARGEWAVARQEYERIVGIYPGTASAWLRLARIHTELGNWNDAILMYETLDGLGPMDRDTRMAYGDALRSAGQLEEALVQYELAVHEAPVVDSVDAALSTAKAALERGEQEQALSAYEQITRNWPGHPTAWLGLARIRAARAEWDAAVAAFVKLEELGPLGREIRLEYGDALRGAGRLEEGVAQYNMAVGQPMSLEFQQTARYLPDAVTVQIVDASRLEEQDSRRPQHMLVVPGEEQRSLEQASLRLEEQPQPEAPAAAEAPTTQQDPPPLQAQHTERATDNWKDFDPAAASFRRSRIEDLPGEDEQSIMAALLPPKPPLREAGGTDLPTDEADVANRRLRNTAEFFKGAEIHTLQTADADPATAGGSMDWLATARGHFEAEQWQDSVLAFENYIEQVGDDALEPEIRLEYALALLEAGQNGLAEENISLVLHQQPDSTAGRIALAKLLSRTGELNDSMLLLDQLRMDRNSQTEVRLARIYGYFHNDYIQETLMDLGELIATNPANADIKELVASGAPWTEVRPLLEARPGNERIIEMAEVVKARLLSEIDVGEADIASVAIQLYESGEYDAAKADFEERVAADPEDSQSWRGLAVLTMVARDNAASIAAWEAYLELLPDDTDARLYYAQVLMRCDCSRALCELWGLIALGEPENEAGRKLYEFQPGVTTLPEDAWVDAATYEDALLNYAIALSICERGKESLYWFRQALYWQPDNPDWQSYYAGALNTLGRYEEALGIYCSVLRSNPGHGAAVLGRGYTHASMGRYRDAFRDWDGIPLDSQFYVPGRIAKAYGLLWKGQRSEAMAMACYAMREDPESCEVWDLLRALKDIPDPSMDQAWRQSHDSEDNDLRANTTSINIPLDARGSAASIVHEDFRLDNTEQGQISDGTATSLGFSLPRNDRERFSVLARYLEIDNDTDPGTDNWDWSAAYSLRINDRRSLRLARDSRMFYDTPQLARSGVVLDEWTLSAEMPFMGDEDTQLIASLFSGSLSDGNSRIGTDWRLQREHMHWGMGRLVYGLHFTTLDYCQDLSSGYWDPNNYRFGEVYADWVDMSRNDFLWDFGVGYGWDDAADRSPSDVLRYKVGLRARLFHDRLTMRAGYSNSELATIVSDGPGYRFAQWSLSGQVKF